MSNLMELVTQWRLRALSNRGLMEQCDESAGDVVEFYEAFALACERCADELEKAIGESSGNE